MMERCRKILGDIQGSTKEDGKIVKRVSKIFYDRSRMMERCIKDPLRYSRIVEGRWKDDIKIHGDILGSTKDDGKIVERISTIF